MLRELCIMKISSASHYCSAENSSEEPKKMIRRTENKWKGWNDIIKTSKQDIKMSVVIFRRLVLIECPVQAINSYCCKQTMS